MSKQNEKTKHVYMALAVNTKRNGCKDKMDERRVKMERKLSNRDTKNRMDGEKKILKKKKIKRGDIGA